MHHFRRGTPPSPTCSSLARAALVLAVCLATAACGQAVAPDLADAEWIWTDAGAAADAPAGTHGFRTAFQLPKGETPKGAVVTITADNLYRLYINGTLVCENTDRPDDWKLPKAVSPDAQLKAGKNVIAIEATNTIPGAAGLMLKLVVPHTKGAPTVITTDDRWKVNEAPPEGWEAPPFDDSKWARAEVLGPLGIGPWGGLGLDVTPGPPFELTGAQWIWTEEEGVPLGAFPDGARYMRGRFEAPQDLRGCKAEIVASADNICTLYLNGKRVGRGTEWNQPARYDVSRHLVPGTNHIAVLGINTLPGPAGLVVKTRISRPGLPPLETVTDASWRVHTEPFPGWESSEFDDSAWPAPRIVAAFGEGPWGERLDIPPRAESQWSFPRLENYSAPAHKAGVAFVEGAVMFGSIGENFIQNIGVSRAFTEFDAPSPAALGRRLFSLIPFQPDGTVALLHDAGEGLLGSPTPSFDGQTVFFTMAPAGEPFFHVYRIGIDGTGFRQVTSGPFHDFDPCELPDGRIAFASTRGGTAEEYHAVAAFSIFSCAPDGSDVRPLTGHIVGDREPRVTADGALVFVRCDNFMERAKVETHIHRTRLDGSGGEIVIGPDRPAVAYDRERAAEAGSAWLRIYGAGSPAPLADGRIAAITERGVVVSPERRGQRIGRYIPYDISPLPDGRLLCTAHDRMRICILDPENGKTEEVVSTDDMEFPSGPDLPPKRGYLDGEIHSAVSLAPRPRPTERPGLFEPPANSTETPTGFLYCQNVLNTRHTGADVGRIRGIRIYEGRPFSLVPTRTIYTHIGTEARELGTVPLAPDGSFYVEVPADRAVAMQAVDAEGRAVINEVSWVYVRPGERRACVGCHAPADTAPPNLRAQAAAAEPFRLTGTGEPHRFRANNAANGGLLNMQYRRFREAGNINLFRESAVARDANAPVPGRRAERDRLVRELRAQDPETRTGAAQRLAILMDPEAVAPLTARLRDESPEVRNAVVAALAACGDRDAIPALEQALADAHPAVAQGAHNGLELLTGLHPIADMFTLNAPARRKVWRDALAAAPADERETALCKALADEDRLAVFAAIEALGHTGGPKAADALRAFLKSDSEPGAELRIRMAAMRALGRLRDGKAVPVLESILRDNMLRTNEGGAREFGFSQRPVYLAAGAAEALGRIGTPACAKILTDVLGKLQDASAYTGACGDHPWLVGCHSSVLHYRILEALDAMETPVPPEVIPAVVRSLPMDKDRGLLFELDGYENLVARTVGRANRSADVTDTALAVLGDTAAQRFPDLQKSVTESPHAEAHIRAHSAEARAAQVLSVVCTDPAAAPRIRARLEHYLAAEPSETRSWACFMLLRCLGNLRDTDAEALFVRVLKEEPDETAGGTFTPPNHWVYKTMKPFFRSAAAHGLGAIQATGSREVLLQVVENLDNAPGVRREAATALARMAGPREAEELRRLAAAYPERATRRALLETAAD